MLDIGWTELLIIGVVALIVVGPKDLPKMFRTLGQLTGKARAMAREFQRAMDAAADESGVKDMARDFRDVASGRKFKDDLGLDELDREMRDMGRPDQWGNESSKKKPTTVAERKAQEQADRAAARDEAALDEAAAADHDATMEARNTKLGALDAERLKAADRAAAARTKAAEIRARREAEAAASPAAPVATPARTPTKAPTKAPAKTATKTPVKTAAQTPVAVPDPSAPPAAIRKASSRKPRAAKGTASGAHGASGSGTDT